MMSTTGRMPVIAAPTANTGEACLGYGGIQYALGPNSSTRPDKDFERSAGFGYVFAHNEYARIAPHLFGQRFADRLRERQFPYCNGSSQA